MEYQTQALTKQTIRAYLQASERTGIEQEEAVALLLTSLVDLICDAGGPRLAGDVLKKLLESVENKTV